MPSKRYIKTYGKEKKIDSNYIPKPVSPFKITEASTVIDALFSHNIKKRKAYNKYEEKNKLKSKQWKVPELPVALYSSLFNNDSLKVKINSTFDNLLQGPVYNQVNLCNKSSFYAANSNTDTSNSGYALENKQLPKRKKKYDKWKKSSNNVSLKGKITKRKYKTKQLKKIVKNVVNLNESKKWSPNISKKLYSYLNKSVNYSLVIDKQSKSSKSPRVLSVSNNKHDSIIFRHGFRQFFRTENTPSFIHSSTPIPSSNLKVDEKLNVSPISVNAKTKLNFTSANSKLCESKKINDTSAQNSVNKNTNSVILINSTFSEIIEPEKVKNKEEKVVVKNNNKNNISNSVIFIDSSRPKFKCTDKNKKIITNDPKLNAKAIVLLDNKIKYTKKNETVSKDIDLKDPKLNTEPIVLIDNIGNIKKLNSSQKNLEPIVYLKRLSTTKYLKVVDKFANKHLTVSESNRSHSLIEELSCIENANTHKKRKKGNTRYPTEIEEILCPNTNSQHSNLKETAINNKRKYESSKNLNEKSFNYSSDVIESSTGNSITTLPKFVTRRRKKVKIDIESIKIHNIEKNECKVVVTKYDDEKLQKFLTRNTNCFSKRKTYGNEKDNSIDLNRNSICLKPGKKWFRSLSILRRTNIFELNNEEQSRKGRNWENSILNVFNQQGYSNVNNDSNGINDMKKKIYSSNCATLGFRKSLKIVNISVKDPLLLEASDLQNKSGYVSTLAHVALSETLNKLSLSTNVDDREETARQIILKRCNQTAPIPFNDCYSSRTLKKCRKIGEGVYGEVFMYKTANDKCRVMKIIPVEGNLVVNGEHQKKFEEIISEIIIASELSNLRKNNEYCTNGFIELQQVFCVQGKYPQHLLDLWDLYDEERGSENDSPEIFSEDQLYIILELENGGQDLEAYRFNNAEQSYALFAQIVCSLAIAESALQFEHRDMHWGNILISPSDEAITTFHLNGREFEIATKGVKPSIIDFTLSRVTYNSCCIYNDLALDPDLFTATGDYQFDVYRLMKQRNENNWQIFEPYSNIVWLDYTLEKMIGHVRYLRGATKTHKNYIRRLSQIRKKILNFNSATELLTSDVFSHVFL